MQTLKRIRENLQQLRDFARVKGARKTLALILGRLGGKRTPEVIRVHPFDTEHGVDTSGLISGWQMPAGHPNDKFSTAYFGVSPSKFAALVGRWAATPGVGPLAPWTFVDLGAGKGRAVLIASTLEFRAVHGVELSAELTAIAERNLAKWQAAGLQAAPATVVCADAVEAVDDLPASPVVLYIHNPFEAPVMRALLQALVVRRHTIDAPVDLLYLVPAAHDVFAEFPQFELLWNEAIVRSPDEPPDGMFAPVDPCLCYRLVAA